MIRVGFVLEHFTWLGGVNYFSNLFSALSLRSGSRIKPIIFTASNAPPSVLARLQHCEIVRTSVLNHRSLLGLARKLTRRITVPRDFFLGRMLIDHQIDILSHGASLAWPRSIRTIGWIPDFQHLHLPTFFGSAELLRRDQEFSSMARECDRVVLSSANAQKDFIQFAPYAAARSRVLRFVPEIDFVAANQPFSILENKFKIAGPYFFLPNQFWIHKNHGLVVAALHLLHQRGIRASVLATGSTVDSRSRDHFPNLMQEVERLGLASYFRVLGVQPYSDVISLMKNSQAVINPSLFEGWSTTVEEAKVLGKVVLLSDLPVHREQNPERGIYFDPRDANDLANAMARVSSAESADEGESKENLQRYELARRQFASDYEQIVVELFDSGLKQDPAATDVIRRNQDSSG